MTYGMDLQETSAKKPVHKRWWFWPLLTLGAIFAFMVNFPTNADRPQTPTPTVTVTASPEPEPTETVEAALEAEEPEPAPAFNIDQENGITRVHFEIKDAWTENGIKRNAQEQTLDGLQAAVIEFPDYDSINVTGEFLMVDKYGNEEMSNIVDLHYEKTTVEKINFENIDPANIFAIQDSGFLHPKLRG